MKFITSLLTIIILTGSHLQVGHAQIELKSSVVGSGGTAASNGNQQLVGTFGQPIVGISSARLTNQSGFWYVSFEMLTSVEPVEDGLLPSEFELEQNYPNPFNPTTTIRFAVPRASQVMLKIYDVLGRRVATLVDESYQAGTYNVTFDAGGLASGIYLYRIEAEGFSQTRKLMLLK